MDDPFELLGKGDIDGLRAVLAANPALAHTCHASGASLLAWAHYVGQPDATALIRPLVETLDPCDAIIADDIDAVKEAIQHGWDANQRSPDGFTPLALAAFFVRPAIFELLLPLTNDVNAPAANPQQVAALHAATARRQPDMVDQLLRAGAEPDLEQADGFTALHVAAQHGDTAVAAMLVLFGADPGRKDAKGRDAIEHARAGGHEWLAKLLKRVR